VYGYKSQSARWRKCVDVADSAVGELLGHYFVDKYFPGDSKTVAKEMIALIKQAFAERVPQLDWMDDATRSAALEKNNQIIDLIGYPDRWTDYSSLTLDANDYFGNLQKLDVFAFKELARKVTEKPDKYKWQMSPPTVNAYYEVTRTALRSAVWPRVLCPRLMPDCLSLLMCSRR
jgi:predicted metalloendopeptidase